MIEDAAEPVFVPVRAVTPVDPYALSVDKCLERLRVNEEHRAFLDAEQARIMARLASSPEPPPGVSPEHYRAKEFVVDEIAAACTWTASAAADRVHTSTALVERLPRVLDALTHGQLSWGHVQAITRATGDLDPTTATQVETRVLPRATQQTTSEFRASVRRAVAALDPRGQIEKHDAAAETRRVFVTADDDAMAWLHAYLLAADARAVITAVQSVADQMTDARTADQKRTDALTQIAMRTLAGKIPLTQGRRPTVEVLVGLTTLLGLDDLPGELAGHGPIPAELARRLADDPTGTWRRLVTDERGQLIDYGRTKYKPPPPLNDHVLARDRTTRGLGRSRKARYCEVDHVIPWAQGGETNESNLHALDLRSHKLKDVGWEVERRPDGTTRWITPRGVIHDKPPEHYNTHSDTESDPPPF